MNSQIASRMEQAYDKASRSGPLDYVHVSEYFIYVKASQCSPLNHVHVSENILSELLFK